MKRQKKDPLTVDLVQYNEFEIVYKDPAVKDDEVRYKLKLSRSLTLSKARYQWEIHNPQYRVVSFTGVY